MHIPRWFETRGMGEEKIATFYGDPVKGAYDPWLATGAEASGWQGAKYVINVSSAAGEYEVEILKAGAASVWSVPFKVMLLCEWFFPPRP